MERLKPCPFCGGKNIVIEFWHSGGAMYMAKCNNPNCPPPPGRLSERTQL